jgi:hypothetical protein
MAWSYAAFETLATAVLQLAELQRHLGEVSQRIQANLTSQGDSRENDVLERYYAQLQKRRAELEQAAAAASGGGFTQGVPA